MVTATTFLFFSVKISPGKDYELVLKSVSLILTYVL